MVVEVTAWRIYATCSERELLDHKICSNPSMCQYYKALVALVNPTHLRKLLPVARYKPCAHPIMVCKPMYRDGVHAVTL